VTHLYVWWRKNCKDFLK